MVTLQKRYTTGPNYQLVRGLDAIKSQHTIENQVFCDTIDKYIGWTILDFNYDIDLVKTITNDIYLATCNWYEGFCTTCFDLVEDVFDFTKHILSDLIGKTICAVGALDDPEILYYQSIVKRYNLAKLEQSNQEPVEIIQKQQEPELQKVSC
jgi:hypothetical protein